MGLFSTSNITCNERPFVGRNFRDNINESASPINRFTEKAETRSFDEIFYEADIAIREASNSMNKLWYKSVLESDTVESAIINEANIFSKMIEVIKTIFDAIKKAISSWVKKAKTLLQKIFKKKPANKSDSKGESKDSENIEKASKSDVRNTDKESTPTDKVEEIKSKKDELEREKKELESKLKEAKKNEEKKKKDESQSGNTKDKKANSSDNSIDTSNIDTSSLDTSNKKSQSAEMDAISSVPEKEPEKKSKGQSAEMDAISVPELEKKSKEIDDELKKVNAELKTAEKEVSTIPQSKSTSSSTASQSQAKADKSSSSSSNDEVSKLYSKYMSDIEGNWNTIELIFKKYYNRIENGPKITPYIDLFRVDGDSSDKIDMNEIFLSSFKTLYYVSQTNDKDFYNAIHTVTYLLTEKTDSGIKDNISKRITGNRFEMEGFKKYLNAKTTVSSKDKNSIIAGFVDELRYDKGFSHSFIPSDQLKSSMSSLDSFKNAIKGGEINNKDLSVSEAVDISISELSVSQMVHFLMNVRIMKKNGGNSKVLKSIEDGLKSIDNAKAMFIRRANFIMNTIKNRIQELSRNHNADTCQYLYNEFTPVIQKAITESISSVAGVINQVFSTRIQLYTEAYTRGNTWFDTCMKLCISAKLADNK